MEYTFSLQELMAKSNYLLAIRDNFESLLSKSVFSIVESQMKNDNVDVNIKNRIFSVVVECVQNICSNDKVHSTTKNSILLLNKIEDGHAIVVGTKLNQDRKDRLDMILTEISSSSLEELKVKKKSIISTRSDLDETQKENLALIDMFIRSAGKVKYHYDGENTENCFLIIEIEILNN
jgi:hypothetical protein